MHARPEKFPKLQTSMKKNMRTGLRIFAALGLVITLLGANPSRSAQAAHKYETFNFVMTAIPSAKYVCVNKVLTFRIVIARQLDPQVGDTDARFDRVGEVRANASVADDLGTINPSILVQYPSFNLFFFRAGKNPGMTNVHFQSYFSNYYNGAGTRVNTGGFAETDAQVEIRDCSYQLEGYPSSMNGVVNTGGLSCDSPYGPWDFSTNTTALGSTSYVREYIPWSEDGKATAMREEHSNTQNITGLDLYGIHDITITPNSGGYQIFFPAPHMIGIWWKPDGIVPVDQFKGDWVMNIVPADPGDCP